MNYNVAFRLEKKAERSDFTVKLEVYVFSLQAFKEITQILLQICLIR